MKTVQFGVLISLVGTGCLIDGDLGRHRALGVEDKKGPAPEVPIDAGAPSGLRDAQAPSSAPACDPSWGPPAMCIPFVAAGNTTSGIREICAVDSAGNVAATFGNPVSVLQAGRVGVFVAFDETVPRLNDIRPMAFMGPVNLTAGNVEGRRGPAMPTPFCHRLLPERNAVWLTIEEPIASPHQVSFILEYPNTHPAYAAAGAFAGLIARFYVAGVP